MKTEWLVLFFVITAGVVWSVRAKKLTLPAAVAGGLIGLLVYAGGGFTGIAMMTAFFLSGSIATSWKIKTKALLGIAEDRQGRRRAAQVIANAGLAGIAGIFIILLPGHELYFQVLMAGSFSAAAGDTLSSELGNIYGKKFVNILNFKKDERGLNGVISFEGTLAGILGSLLIATIYSIGTGSYRYILLLTVAGLIGNLTDSVLGATYERSAVMNNEAVNFFNTLSGALAAAGLLYLFF